MFSRKVDSSPSLVLELFSELCSAMFFFFPAPMFSLDCLIVISPLMCPNSCEADSVLAPPLFALRVLELDANN
jgi:hypothetical protein